MSLDVYFTEEVTQLYIFSFKYLLTYTVYQHINRLIIHIAGWGGGEGVDELLDGVVSPPVAPVLPTASPLPRNAKSGGLIVFET